MALYPVKSICHSLFEHSAPSPPQKKKAGLGAKRQSAMDNMIIDDLLH